MSNSPSGGPAVLITIFAPSNVHLLEIAGVQDALFEANSKLCVAKPYRVQLVTERGPDEERLRGDVRSRL